jgi:protein-tyrosine phosphatase
MKILFICTGNTCRSCMAEAIFNQLCNMDGFESFSAGVCAIPGSLISKNSSKLLKDKLNYDISNRRAVQLESGLLKSVDLILAMSKSVQMLAINNFGAPRNITYTLNEYVGVSGEVSDPYGGSLSVYEKTYEQLNYLINLSIIKLKEDKGVC